jgi:hypothetical protein
MFDPVGDINWTWKTVRDNAKVLSAMGLTGADNLTVAKRIIKTSNYDDLANNERRLCIFFLPSRPRINNLRTPEMIQIDCHVPFRESMRAYEAMAAVHKALQGKRINGKVFEYAGMLGELATAPGYFCAGIRYEYHGSV